MREFLHDLLESGRVSVAPVLEKKGGEDLTSVILDFDRASRLNLVGEAPKVDLPAAQWAATLLYMGCQLVVLRNVDAAEAAEVLQLACPSKRSPETDYSVDLFFRYLPDLYDIAKRVAADDPLVSQLEGLAAAWPLSSVRMQSVGQESIDFFIHDASLRQLYVDRIIESKAFRLAKHPEIVEGIRASYGAFPELCPEMDQALSLTSAI